MIRHLFRLPRLRQWLHAEDGTATMEFALMLPLLMTIFMASFESGLLLVRHTMLDRALDMTMRELRLGHFPGATHDTLKTEICSHMVVIKDCTSVLKITLQQVDTNTWTFPADAPVCRDRALPIDPVTTFNPGGAEAVMLVRACIVADALFPSTGIGLGLPKDGQGGYRLIAQSAFANEPS